MMLCTVFSNASPMLVCGREAFRYGPLAIGSLARMREKDDALLMAYVPLCAHHAEMTPPTFKLYSSDDLQIAAHLVPDAPGPDRAERRRK